ncbi:hypothetical protein KJ632_03885 [Patescibacteria group bacterium]|nr:hypothetical protein [Patescibacteria group bacterium]
METPTAQPEELYKKLGLPFPHVPYSQKTIESAFSEKAIALINSANENNKSETVTQIDTLKTTYKIIFETREQIEENSEYTPTFPTAYKIISKYLNSADTFDLLIKELFSDSNLTYAKIDEYLQRHIQEPDQLEQLLGILEEKLDDKYEQKAYSQLFDLGIQALNNKDEKKKPIPSAKALITHIIRLSSDTPLKDSLLKLELISTAFEISTEEAKEQIIKAEVIKIEKTTNNTNFPVFIQGIKEIQTLAGNEPYTSEAIGRLVLRRFSLLSQKLENSPYSMETIQEILSLEYLSGIKNPHRKPWITESPEK